MKTTKYQATVILEVRHENGKPPTAEQVGQAAEQAVSLDIGNESSEAMIGEDATITSASVDWAKLHKVETRG